MIIHNYGLFWEVQNVFWGKPKNPGNLYGIRQDARKTDKVDFREQSGIYALYADYELVYIGQAGSGKQRLMNRLKHHTKGQLAGRWNRFSWFGTRPVIKNQVDNNYDFSKTLEHNQILNHMEGILISVSEPSLNRQGGKWGKDVEQYLQFRDDKLGPSIEEMIVEMWKHKKKN